MLCSQVFVDATRFIVTELEGGYSKHPKDPGGVTIFGMTERYNPVVVHFIIDQLKLLNGSIQQEANKFIEYIRFYGKNSKIEIDSFLFTIYSDIWLKLLTEYYDLYFKVFDYWILEQSEENTYNDAAKIAVFCYDTAVNMGVSTAITFLQSQVSDMLKGEKLVIDGIFGTKTSVALLLLLYDNKGPDLLKLLFSNRRTYYINLCKLEEKKKVFLHGWLNRLSLLEDYIEKMDY